MLSLYAAPPPHLPCGEEVNDMVLNYERIGVHIRVMRKKRGLSQENLAEMTEMSTKYISHIETAKKNASLESIVKIADALGITVDRLLYGVQRNDKTAYEPELHEVISDCNSYEKSVILDTVAELKRSLRKNKDQILKGK